MKLVKKRQFLLDASRLTIYLTVLSGFAFYQAH